LIEVESTSKGQFEAVKLTIEELDNKISKLSPETATLSFQERVRKSILKKIMTMKSNPNLLNDMLINTKSTVQPMTPVKELKE
jgi:predicted  nucleic acid-binding Zn-ribbon protein